jgi:hypothetical protein
MRKLSAKAGNVKFSLTKITGPAFRASEHSFADSRSNYFPRFPYKSAAPVK